MIDFFYNENGDCFGKFNLYFQGRLTDQWLKKNVFRNNL